MAIEREGRPRRFCHGSRQGSVAVRAIVGGYRGGYTAVSDFVRDVRPAADAGFEVRFETAPGEQGQVDFAQF